MHIHFSVNERVRKGVILRCGIYGLITVIFAFWTFSMYMDSQDHLVGIIFSTIITIVCLCRFVYIWNAYQKAKRYSISVNMQERKFTYRRNGEKIFFYASDIDSADEKFIHWTLKNKEVIYIPEMIRAEKGLYKGFLEYPTFREFMSLYYKELELSSSLEERFRELDGKVTKLMTDLQKPLSFKSKFIMYVIFWGMIIATCFVLSYILNPESVPAKVENVYIQRNKHIVFDRGKSHVIWTKDTVVQSSPCNAYYVSLVKNMRGDAGVSLQLEKNRDEYRLKCHSQLQRDYFGHDYYNDWLDSLKSLPEEKRNKDWIMYQGKWLTFYFENGDSLKLFPANKKIYFKTGRHHFICAYYPVSQETKYLLMHNNIVRMKMDNVFEHNEIRKELKDELTERFDLLDNYVFRYEDVKK